MFEFIFARKGVFKQLTELFENQIYNTFHTNTLHTLLVTITRLVHRLSKASRHTVTPVWALQRLSKAITHLAAPIPALQRLSKVSTCLANPARAPQRLLKASTHLATPVELHRDCQRLVHIWQPPFKLHSVSRSLEAIQNDCSSVVDIGKCL